jgi:acyl-CoA dehydrogenase
VDFSPTEDQQTIRDAVLAHCSRFPDDYWLERDNDGVFPEGARPPQVLPAGHSTAAPESSPGPKRAAGLSTRPAIGDIMIR